MVIRYLSGQGTTGGTLMPGLDGTLKNIMRRSRRITGVLGYEGTPVEFPANKPVVKEVTERFIDGLFVMECEGEEPYILQIEHQSTPDEAMADRMHAYLADLRYWRPKLKRLRDLKIKQVVVYVGEKPWKNPPISIDEENFKYKYQFVYANTIDPLPLLDSENIADVVYAVLCHGGTEVPVLRKVLERIEREPASERAELLVALMQFCGLRRIDRLAVSDESYGNQILLHTNRDGTGDRQGGGRARGAGDGRARG